MTTESTVRTTSGAVRGTSRDGVHAFLGIPYAAPPFGPRRFAAPQPPEPWDGVRPATAYGPTVPKPPYAPPYDLLLPEPVIPGEDCLNLNVWTPDPGASGLPVFVWIHGGAFVNGSGAVPVYDGATFARDGVVCVTINYRLGVDGFLQFADGGPANRGLLDQLAALRWVQENVAAFGGDPARVTVGGESAGAMSTGALLAMPSAQGLFAQAVLQSGAGHHALSAATATRIGGYLAERLGRPAEREALAGVPLPELIAAQQAVAREAATQPDPARWGEVTTNLMAFEPVVDGEVLPDLPIRRIAAGSARDVAVLVGANREEQRLFLVPNGLIDLVDDQLLQLAVAAYGAPVGKTLEAYTAGRPGATPGELLADVATDWFYRIPAVRLAEAQTGGGAARVGLRVLLALPAVRRPPRCLPRPRAGLHLRHPRAGGARRAHGTGGTAGPRRPDARRVGAFRPRRRPGVGALRPRPPPGAGLRRAGPAARGPAGWAAGGLGRRPVAADAATSAAPRRSAGGAVHRRGVRGAHCARGGPADPRGRSGGARPPPGAGYRERLPGAAAASVPGLHGVRPVD